MGAEETTVLIIVIILLAVGLIGAIIGVFLFNNFNWWDKL